MSTVDYGNMALNKRKCIILFFLFITSFILTGCINQKLPVIALHGTLPISAAKVIVAGTPTTVTVGPVAGVNGLSVVLIAAGSYGPRLYQTVFQRNIARFNLSGQETQQAGIVRLTAQADQAQGSVQLLIQSSHPIEPLTPLIGARGIIADGMHWSMTVVIPFDTYGNPVMEGTRIDVLVRHPDAQIERKSIVVHNLLAWVRIFSHTLAGRSLISATIGNVHGFEGTLLEVPGWPSPFTVFAIPQPLAADGRLITTLYTTVIRDRYGNIMPDGTLVTFMFKDPNGSFGSIPAYTINGIAEVPFPAPLLSGDYVLHATMLGVVSQSSIVHFAAGPTMNLFPMHVQVDAMNNSYVLQAGPLLASLGQYIPDGTPVHFVITNASGKSQQLDSLSNAGYTSIQLLMANFPAGNYSVQATIGSHVVTQKITLR